jgi:hypothetical protein
MTEVDTVESWIYGTLPVIETWIDCRHTKVGWCGRRKSDGAPVNITYDPRDYGGQPPLARMPEKNWGVWRENGRVIGAIRIERAPLPFVSRKGRRGKARAVRAA